MKVNGSPLSEYEQQLERISDAVLKCTSTHEAIGKLKKLLKHYKTPSSEFGTGHSVSCECSLSNKSALVSHMYDMETELVKDEFEMISYHDGDRVSDYELSKMIMVWRGTSNSDWQRSKSNEKMFFTTNFERAISYAQDLIVGVQVGFVYKSAREWKKIMDSRWRENKFIDVQVSKGKANVFIPVYQ